jgi:hypothetical protein
VDAGPPDEFVADGFDFAIAGDQGFAGLRLHAVAILKVMATPFMR